MDLKIRKDYDKNKLYFTEFNCPFCTEFDKKRIIFENDFWIVVKNLFPFFEDKLSLIAFPKRHLEFTVEFNKEELLYFIEVENFMKSFFKWKEYFSFIRQTKWNKSVEHLHYHYVEWMPSSKIIDWENYFKVKY